MGQCRNCWWLSDEKTGICCHEKSEYNLCFVNMDNVCPMWSARDGSNFEEKREDNGDGNVCDDCPLCEVNDD